MIQRIQSIFLLAVAVCGFIWAYGVRLDFIAGALSFNADYREVSIFDTSFKSISFLTLVPILFNCISILLAVMAIFLYKNFNIQMRLCGLIILLNVFVFFPLSILACGDNANCDKFYPPLPIFAIICAIIAFFFIRRDDDKVQSADRIR